MTEVLMPTLSSLRADSWRDWHPLGECANQDKVEVEAWFARDTYGIDARQARAVCAICPVRELCLGYALNNPELVGIWGGTDEHERATIRKRVRRRG